MNLIKRVGEIMECNNKACEMNNVTDNRCCFYCEYKANCMGLCVNLQSDGDYEDVAKGCIDFVEC